MPLSPSALKSDLMSAMQNLTQASQAVSKFSDVLKSFIESATIMYAWVGIGPPPSSSPDPVTSFKCDIAVSASLQVPPNFAAFVSAINTMVSTTIITAPAGFALPPAAFLAPVSISQSGANNWDAAITTIASQICSGILGNMCTPVLAGTHGAFTGTASFTSIM